MVSISETVFLLHLNLFKIIKSDFPLTHISLVYMESERWSYQKILLNILNVHYNLYIFSELRFFLKFYMVVS